MRELSNNIIAMLTVVLIITISLQFTAYHLKYQQITAKATGGIGFVGLCLDNEPAILPIPDQVAGVGRLYVYDVNTNIANDSNVTFYDDTYLFNISNSTGLISFIPSEDETGTYNISISVFSRCGVYKDTEVMRLAIERTNHPPVLDPIPDIVINQSDLLIYDVNATDPDNDTLFFGDDSTMFQINSNTGVIYFTPTQQDVGKHSVMIWVIDGYGGVDWQSVNFEIVDINDAPSLHTIGAQTAVINETFELKVNATDVDVRPEWNNITFHDDSAFFDIDNETGNISFFATDSMNGTYWINISVTDGFLWDWEVISFSVVAVNHPPNITSWYPENDTIYIYEGQSQYFNITKYDPDGTVPSSQWYLESSPLNGETGDEYTYYTGYISSGTHNVTVIISDGEFTDSHEWTVIVRDAIPPPATAAPPSGGQTIPPPCVENWRCNEWSVCPIYEIQTRKCTDVNECGTVNSKPEERRKCAYSPQPSCTDGMTNCHDMGCEIWIDCGGPCPPCPTCSDGIKNCHTMLDGKKICEQAIDCGGPCPTCPEPKKAVCGNGICEEGEAFSCAYDCGLFAGQFLLAVIIMAGASILVYRSSALLFALYRKKIKPVPYTNLELLGAQTLRKIHLIQLEAGRKPVKTIASEFSMAMREFFEKAFEIHKKFTYIELAEVARKRKVEKVLAGKISEFCIRMTEIEYKTTEPSMADISAAIKSAIFIVEKISGIRIHDSLEKRAEEEISKVQPKEKEAKLTGAQPEKPAKKHEKTGKEAESIRSLEKLISEGERAMTEHRQEDAERVYSQIREIYDRLDPEVKNELYNETIRIIKLYNSLMRELK
jgi:hypothetical protein